MRSRINRRLVLLVPVLAAFVLLAAACEEDNGIDVLDDNDTPTPTTPTPAPVDDMDDDAADPAEPAAPSEIRADINEIDGSGISGEVIVRSLNGTAGPDNGTGFADDDDGLTDDDDMNGLGQTGQTEVEVDLSGLDAAGTYSHGIFRGSCQDIENGMTGFNDDANGLDDDDGLNGMNGDEYLLDPIMVDEDGNATLTSTIDADFAELSFGHYYAVFDGADADTGTAVACADIEENDDDGLFDDGDDDFMDDDDNGLFDDEEADDTF